MAGFVGSALSLSWRMGGGTIDLAVDFRTWNYSPSVTILEETAGAATNREKLVSFKDGAAQAGGVLQAGSMAQYGTALTEGNRGTLVWCPEGTANGKYHGTAEFISMGLQVNPTYDQVVEWACSWEQSGARTEGTIN